MLKRVISFLLCVNILVSMLPVQSFATEDVTESTEQIVTTEPLEETTEPSEAVTEPSEEVTMPTVAVTEPTEEITVPTEFVVDVTEPEATTESEPVCTDFVDCPVSDHDDGCEQKAAEQAAVDQAAADAVAVLIDELPSLEEIQTKPMEEQGADYNQVNAAYDAYCALSADQQALLPPAEDVFKLYFDYFSRMIQEASTFSGTCGENIRWSYDSNSGTLTLSGTGKMADYAEAFEIPWIDYRGSIENLVLSEGITYIGESAFGSCELIEELVIPNGVTEIGPYAFAGCGSLSNITLPESLDIIGEAAFTGSGLSGKVVIPEGVTEIGIRAFDRCASLSDVILPESLETIGEYAFWKSGLTGDFTIPGGISIIGEYAFRECKKMTKVPQLSEGLKTIGAGAFLDCSNMEGILIIPDSVTTIGMSAFEDCSAMQGVVFGSGLTQIETQVFYGCASLSGQLILPDGLTKIGSYAFADCIGLEGELLIPNSVESIDMRSFYNCTGLTSITLGTGLKYLGNNINDENKHSPFAGCNNVTEVTFLGKIPPTLSSLTITLYNTFMAMAGLETIWVPAEGYDAYVTAIADNVSDKVSIKSIISQGACGEKLKWILDNHDTLTISGTGAMYEYTTADEQPWYNYQDSIQTLIINDDVTSIGAYAFAKCTKLTSLTMPDTVTRTGRHAFYDCTALSSIELSTELTEIGNSAFGYCKALSAITIPDKVTSIGENAFNATTNLEQVTLGSSVRSIGGWAFQSSSISEVIIPATVTSISNFAFMNCTKLSTITFEGTPPTLGDSTFYNVTATAYYSANNPTWTSDVMQNYGGTITWEPYTTEHIHEYGDDHKCECGAIGGTCGENLTWVLNDEGTLTISGVGAMTDYVSTDEQPWCDYQSEITTLVIEDEVTTIGEIAFALCENLRSIDFGQVSSIGRYAFGHCKSLNEELVIPDSVDYIGEMSFANCSNLTRVTILGNLSSLGDDAFWSCHSVTEITFTGATVPNPCSLGALNCLKYIYVPGESLEAYTTSISGSFLNAEIQAISSEITQGTCGENLTWSFDESSHTLTISGIGAMTNFKSPIGAPWSRYGHRSKISTVVIADGITSIGDYAFRNCDNLAGELVIPDSVTNIGKYAFCNSGNIDVSIGSGLLEIPSGAFSGSGIKTIDFGEITTIGDHAFQNCDGLDGDLVIPDSVITMGGSAFEDCDGVDTLTIGDGLKVLPGAFTSCDNLKCIDIGGVTNISDAAFHGCKSLTSIDFKNVTTIGQEAFSDCDSLVELLIPDTVTTMYAFSFGECKSLSSVTLGSGLSSMGDDYFNAFERCTSLTSITFTGNTVPAIGGGFTSLTALETIYVPAESLDAYATALMGLLPTNTTIHAMIPNRLILDSEALDGYDSVWIDGTEIAIQKDGSSWYIDLADSNARVMTTYTYHVDAAAEDGVDTHRRYPISMQVWTLENRNGVYSATRQEDFDDILQYSGTAIRVTGKQGIRMITSIDEGSRDSLTGNGLAGYTLKEYGTAIAWAGQLSNTKPLVLGKSYVSSNYAYKKDVADPIFAYVDGRIQYTNVLVGFNLDQCKNDIAMRPYMILEDAEGNEITLYGGIVERSIGYIALRNRKTFTENTDPYDYVWEIIHAVYGDAYDADWKPT